MPWTDLRRSMVACTLGALCAACGGDGPNDPPPKPTQLLLVTAPSPDADTRAPLGTQPVVQLADANGRAARATATVTATVISGDGAVLSGASATSNASGRATFAGLTLGSASGDEGPLTLQFSAPELTPVTAAVQLHCAFPPLAVGQTISASLANGDCAFRQGSWFSNFGVATTQAVNAVQLTLGPHALAHPFLGVRGPDDPSVYWGYSAGSSLSLSFRALLPAGHNGVQVSTTQPHEAGTFTLGVASAPEDITCTDTDPWIAGSLTTSQQLATNDCTDGDYLGDFALVGLAPGNSLTFSASSGWFQPWIALFDAYTGDLVAQAQGDDKARIVYASTGDYAILYLAVTSQSPGGSGPYALSVAVGPKEISAPAVPGRVTVPAPVRPAWPSRLRSSAPRGMMPAWHR